MSKDSSSLLNYKNSREHVAAILSQTTAYVPSNDPAVLYQVLVDIAKYARNLEELLAVASGNLVPSASAPPEDVNDDSETPDENETDVSNYGVLVDVTLTDPLRRLAISDPSSRPDDNYRFFGPSSTMKFIKDALAYAGAAYTFDAQRPEFWVVQRKPIFHCKLFPDDDLLQDLIDIYFRRIHPLFFLLHAPSFRASVANGEHLHDRYFACVVLLVCALASRLSEDPRVLMAPDAPLDSAGWKWFLQVEPLKVAISPSNPNCRWIYKLQLLCLSVQFLGGTTYGRSCWTISGVALRVAQEMGAHRRTRYNTCSKSEGELLKRAFWILLAMDTITNSMFGCPAVITREDYDTELPIECDDDYWAEPHCFKQPPGVPAQSAYMTTYLKLMLIYQRVQRVLYGIKRPKGRELTIVAELDSDLNKWLDSIPNHLRWDPNCQGIFLDQSAALYVTYYHIQILIHRPFIPSPGESSTAGSTFPSLAICANSARSCGHVLEVQSRRSDALYQPHNITALFDSAVVLLLNVWGGRRAKLLPSDIARAANDIKKCVDVLHLYEKRYPIAGRKCDIITEIFNRGSGNTPRSSLKRPIPDDMDDGNKANAPNKIKRPSAAHVNASASAAHKQLEELELSMKQTDHLFSLPLYTQELGLLPIYESFDFQFGLGLDSNNMNQIQNQTPSPQSSTSGSSAGVTLSSSEQVHATDLAQTGHGYAPPGDELRQFDAEYCWNDWNYAYPANS
ncbi:Zn(2)-C6 fungal-type domain-containing protein [Mycena sanguinolenta]|uniref:Zn(2)-C6 fungal-type domain-containing protein n=1 Tax=Mycena sanguinolenta TaxID=230812 RepID=A0A8H6XI64_9AGAR|nr:Zn(2)-C6 fungal-type domain-containing protein [Mycena sanguinolenta]